MTSPVPVDEVFSNYSVINNEPFSRHLTAFLNTKADTGYVLNLNAGWGAGKTTFLHCWYNSLKKDHPVIYFDAWKSDFSKDPMLALVDCFMDQLKNPKNDNKELMVQFLEKGGYFIKKALPSLAVGYIKHKTGIPGEESLFEETTKELGITEKEGGEAVKEVLKAVCEQREQLKGIKEFKDTIEKMARQIKEISEGSEHPKSYPIYVLVDELDRCRPNYAIEVIESIKHFFDTKHFVFVLATDTEQLQHSIKSVYGEGFDAYSYLSRFFHRTVTLPPPSTKEYLKSRLTHIIDEDFTLEEEYILEILVSIFEWHNMTSLREIDKVIQDIELAKSTRQSFKLLPLVVLSLLKRLHPVKYSRFITSNQLPYKTRNSATPRSSQHLEANDSLPEFSFDSSRQSKLGIEQILYNILDSINNTSYYIRWDIIKSGDLSSEQAEKAISDISLRYRLNEDQELAVLPNYISVLELAGHFDSPLN